jgi:hypothetical protein
MKNQAVIIALFFGIISSIYASSKRSRIMSTHGYENCIELSNSICRVVLEPNCGGRVLVYEIEGKNALYIDPNQNGFMPTPEEWKTTPGSFPSAGRFCVGPEKTFQMPKIFWLGEWNAKITGDFSATLTSQIDEKTNLQLVRSFVLDSKTSQLKITQTIKNLGDIPHKLCYWSRTFATGGGICIVPISNPNRFPKGFMDYGDGDVMRYMPDLEESIKVVDDYLLILGPCKSSKFVFDSNKGWIAYITKDDMLFVKTYDYNKSYVYGEMAAVPLSIWYFKEIMAELEPIGPWEWVAPKGETSYSEIWNLLPYQYPKSKEVNVKIINDKVKALN